MRSLRKRFKLGEFAPKRSQRAAKRAGRRGAKRRKLATISSEARSRRIDALEIKENIEADLLERARERGRRRTPRSVPPVFAGQPTRSQSTLWSVS